MAIFYPASPSPKIQGENKVLEILQNNLVDSWIGFHEPSLDGDNPDFILFSPYYGMIVLEVKDYKLNTIQQMTIESWTILADGNPKKVTAPLKQVRGYAYKLINLLEQSNLLVNSSGNYQGRLKFPVVYACWFVNLTSDDVLNQNIQKTIPEKWIFTADDFKSEIESKIIKTIRDKFQIPKLSNDVLTEVQRILYPDIIVPRFDERRQLWFEDFKRRLTILPSIIDEILFIATEIRNQYAKGVALCNIYIYYVEDKFTKNGSIAEEINNICISMGIACTLHNRNDFGVNILPLDKLKSHLSSDFIFIMDISLSGINEERELSLRSLLKENSLNVYLSSSDMS
ncbi:nuclease-related domain-containing protein [Paenibacillus sp. NRS-1760]|uniref:nuclease-related domain-containing protein n=1 Tax=Paenibacillus sp. NRS-1760 TaxID=3233902 RepID=UPI003D27D497